MRFACRIPMSAIRPAVVLVTTIVLSACLKGGAPTFAVSALSHADGVALTKVAQGLARPRVTPSVKDSRTGRWPSL